jgi:hypothetical protein
MKMVFTKTDFRQFFDEIQVIRRRKEFSSTFKEHLKGLGFRKAERALEVLSVEGHPLKGTVSKGKTIPPVRRVENSYL